MVDFHWFHMVHFQHIIIAAICLLPWYYVFNAEYPKEPTGHSKSMSGQTLPIVVENFISKS